MQEAELVSQSQSLYMHRLRLRIYTDISDVLKTLRLVEKRMLMLRQKAGLRVILSKFPKKEIHQTDYGFLIVSDWEPKEDVEAGIHKLDKFFDGEPEKTAQELHRAVSGRFRSLMGARLRHAKNKAIQRAFDKNKGKVREALAWCGIGIKYDRETRKEKEKEKEKTMHS